MLVSHAHVLLLVNGRRLAVPPLGVGSGDPGGRGRGDDVEVSEGGAELFLRDEASEQNERDVGVSRLGGRKRGGEQRRGERARVRFLVSMKRKYAITELHRFEATKIKK